MTALLRIIPLEKIIMYALMYLRGITREQWKFALSTIASLAERKMENSERWHNAKSLLSAFGVKDSAARNYLIESAVSYVEKGLHK